jgi:hypothetical protein
MGHQRYNRALGVSVRDAVADLDPMWVAHFTDTWIKRCRGIPDPDWRKHGVCVLLDCRDPALASAWGVMEISVTQDVRDRVYRGCEELGLPPVAANPETDAAIREMLAAFE